MSEVQSVTVRYADGSVEHFLSDKYHIKAEQVQTAIPIGEGRSLAPKDNIPVEYIQVTMAAR